MCRALVLLAALAACGDNLPAAPDAPTSPSGLLDQLNALPGVTAEEHPTGTSGYTYLVLHFTQPVDHDDPGAGTFQQEVSLLHKDAAAPMIVQTSGYWDYYLDSPVELTRLLGANQISIEHRYFAESRPQNPDWSKLTIEQMADDEHAIIAALHTIYPGAFITTGGSKGGMTAVFHRRFYPDDVAGSVPYVAPISFGAPDTRYPAFIAGVGDATCHQKVRDLAVEMLSNRRAALLAKAQAQAADTGMPHSYTRIAIGPALESSIISLEWSFWQYYGTTFCNQVPSTNATDAAVWSFLDLISPVTDNDDVSIGQFDAYYYQADQQLGYPADGTDAYLKTFEMYTDADYVNSLPTADPPYDGGAAMHDIDDWVKQHGDKLVFVYGQWDPWTGGAFDLGAATDSLKLVQAQGTHNARLGRLSDADRDAAFAKIAAWTGVTPTITTNATTEALAPEPREPRIPPAALRARRAIR